VTGEIIYVDSGYNILAFQSRPAINGVVSIHIIVGDINRIIRSCFAADKKRPLRLPPNRRRTERVTSVLGTGIIWKGNLSGSGGVRIEGAFEGEINLRGLLVVGETGRVTCEHLKANVVIIAGAVRGDITCEKLEIRATGRVWGNVVTAAFATEEGAFLRGQIA